MLSRTVRVAHPRFARSIRVWGKRWEAEVRDGKRVERRSEYVPGRGWVVERAEEEEYDGGGEIDLITLKRVPRAQNSWDPDIDRKKCDHERNTGFLEGFLQESSPAPPSQDAKSSITPQKNPDLPSGVAAATPTYPDPEQAPPPLPPRPTQPPPPPPRDKPESSSLESDSGSDSDSDIDILPSDVRSSAGRPVKSKYEIEIERERRMRREAMILEWERLREEEEKEESAMNDIRAYRMMREQKEAQKREAERKEIEKKEAEEKEMQRREAEEKEMQRREEERREAEEKETQRREEERREAEEKEMQRREEERREQLRLESQRAVETEMEMERERILQEAEMKAGKGSPAAAKENKEEWDWSGTDTPTAEDIYKTPQHPPTQKYFVLTRNPSTNDFNFAPLPLALSPISLEQTTPIKVLENMQSPEKFIGYWGVVQRLGFEIVAGERECVIVRASTEDADEKMESMLQEIEGMQKLQTRPVPEDTALSKRLDAITADIAGKIGLGGKPPPVVEEPPKVFEEFSSLVGETSKPLEKEPESIEQETAKPMEEIVKSQEEASPEAREPTPPEEDFKFKRSDPKLWDQINEDAKHSEMVEEKIEPEQAHHEVIITPPMKTAAEEPVEIETNNAWHDKYRFTENPEKTFQQPTEETLFTEAPKVIKEVPKAEEATKKLETTTAADPWAFIEEQTSTTQSPPSETTQPFLSPASEVARENWEKKRGSPPPLTPAEELLAKPVLEKPILTAPTPSEAVNPQQQGKSKQGKKPKRKIFWTSVWVAAATGGTSFLLENYF
ncbi:hypothetical protein C7212DRAFT_298910 [Tuber magnatum]|uniref:Uncharacterized protein n=1 Tax=Tuber magnatum TaxID=42249 RepID=A0A317SKX0_9PEZI|nr:hypothetical protein C7212DRAFT_298910 [Tuber magnatum]